MSDASFSGGSPRRQIRRAKKTFPWHGSFLAWYPARWRREWVGNSPTSWLTVSSGQRDGLLSHFSSIPIPHSSPVPPGRIHTESSSYAPR